jgi:peptidoglycan hydrolase CwlO-like protein
MGVESMKRVFCFALCTLFVASSIITFLSCAPNPDKIYKTRVKEQEYQELQERVIELESEVDELKTKLDACEDDYQNLLFYNREKETLEKRIEALEKKSGIKETR